MGNTKIANLQKYINQTNVRRFQMLERVHQPQSLETTPRPLKTLTHLRRKREWQKHHSLQRLDIVTSQRIDQFINLNRSPTNKMDEFWSNHDRGREKQTNN